jgi:cyclase
MRPRVIPCLLLNNGGLVKTTKFRDPGYVGDPINAMRIFNEKEVDEIAVLDISATPNKRGPDLDVLRDIVEEAFMPVAYGGGIRSVDEAASILAVGIEKVVINTCAMLDPDLIPAMSRRFGSQSVVVAIDVRKKMFGGYDAVIECGRRGLGQDPVIVARRMRDAGAGEILLNAIDRDGTREGYDLKLIAAVSAAVDVPVIACGGAGQISDFSAATEAGAAAVAAGSFFVHHGPRRAVLISYPTAQDLAKIAP